MKKIGKIIEIILCLPYLILKKIFNVFSFAFFVITFSFKKSYFPEAKRKNAFHRMFDLVRWQIKNHDRNTFYYLYGLDVKNTDMSNYVSERFFWSTLMDRNQLVISNKYCVAGSQIYYLRDKFAFYEFMKNRNQPVPEVFCLMKDGAFYDSKMNPISLEQLKQKKDFFVKDADGQCASFVKHVSSIDELNNYPNLKNGEYILQEAVHQSDEMNAINPCSLNTLRICTVNNGEGPYFLTAVLRVGTKKTGNVDNWAAGGLSIGIDENGRLAKYGFYKPIHGTKARVHPDTGIVFEETVISQFKQACELVCNAHKLFYGVHSIGWDIALTDKGPVIIEGNDNWEMSLMQACNGGLKDKWEKAVKK